MGSVGGYDAITWAVLAAFAAANLVVLLAAGERGGEIRRWVLRQLQRITRRSDLDWFDWVPVWVGGVAIFSAVVAYGLLSGQYACSPASDAFGLLASGRAFWAGQDPFRASICGGAHEIPYGFAAVLIDGIGSIGGIVGIYAIWGFIAFAIVPLAWAVAGKDRRWVLAYLASSVLLIPLVSTQIDGATNALVPATVLLSLYLARRRERAAAIVGGFLSTARFPNIFPLLSMTGANRRYRVGAFALVALAFAAVSALSYLYWGMEFVGPVFLDQLGRRSFSLNFYGVLLFANALPSTVWVEGIQSALTIALVLVVFVRVRSPLLGAALTLTGVALLTPFLSYNILVWLLPVALIGARARWWLWGIAVVGSVNYDLAYVVWASQYGLTWPSAVLDLVLTGLLLGLFVELWRQVGIDRAPVPGASPTAGNSVR